MNPTRWERIKHLYDAAQARPSGERAAFLAEACGEDEALCREVQALLDQPIATADFLEFVGGPAPTPTAPLRARRALALVGRRLGVHQVEALVGRGGMGEVYRARDTRLGRDVAIKVLPRAFTADAERLARFEREARVLASLNHPNIAAIHGVEDCDGAPALVMELVEGETLAERLARA